MACTKTLPAGTCEKLQVPLFFVLFNPFHLRLIASAARDAACRHERDDGAFH